MAGSQWFPALGLARGRPGPAHQLHVGQLLGQSVGVTADAEELPVNGGWRLGPVGDGLVGTQQAFWALALGGEPLVQSLQELLHSLPVRLQGGGRRCAHAGAGPPGWELWLPAPGPVPTRKQHPVPGGGERLQDYQ